MPNSRLLLQGGVGLDHGLGVEVFKFIPRLYIAFSMLGIRAYRTSFGMAGIVVMLLMKVPSHQPC